MMCYCDYDYPSFCNRNFPKARKTHWCEECGAAIRVGTRYCRITGKWDDVQSYIRCRHCEDISKMMEWYSRVADRCFCDTFTQLMENVGDEWRENRNSLVGRAYVAMQRRWYSDRDERKVEFDRRKAERDAKKQNIATQ